MAIEKKKVVMNKHNSQERKTKLPCVVQYSGSKIGRQFILQPGENLIGQRSSLQVSLTGESVSDIHARILILGDEVVIEEMSQMNRTYVNEFGIQNKAILRDGDIIRVGNILLKFFKDGLAEQY